MRFKKPGLRTFKTKPFARFARREDIADKALCEAVERAERDLIDADLGGGVIKQRIARPGQGRSGRFRVMVVFRCGNRDDQRGELPWVSVTEAMCWHRYMRLRSA